MNHQFHRNHPFHPNNSFHSNYQFHPNHQFHPNNPFHSQKPISPQLLISPQPTISPKTSIFHFTPTNHLIQTIPITLADLIMEYLFDIWYKMNRGVNRKPLLSIEIMFKSDPDCVIQQEILFYELVIKD